MFEEVIVAFQEWPEFYLFVIFILGLMIGSFLNVVIYRLPLIMERSWVCECRELLEDEINPKKLTKDIVDDNFSLSFPASSCPHCQHKIRFWQNIPIVSWLLLKGQCANCKKSISARYPAIELVTGLMSVVVAGYFGVTWQAVAALVLTWCLISLTLIDYDHMLLPDQITLPLLWFGLLININGLFIPLTDAVIGAAAGYMSLFSVFWLFKLLTGKEGMGYGDFKLMAVFGAWLGWQLLPLIILLSSVVGAVVGITLVLLKKQNRENPIPFGPYIAAAGWIALLFGTDIWSWYLGQLGG